MPRRYITAAEKEHIRIRAKDCCEYCQILREYAVQSFVIEHIFPVSRGGETELSNLALACGGCNSHKHAKVEDYDPVDGILVPLFHPRQHLWIEHFVWNDDYSQIIGTTAVGRATVASLKLNRPGLINLRQLLRTNGKHPPKFE